jgi:amidase
LPDSQLFVEETNGEKMPNYMRWFSICSALITALPASVVIPCGLDAQGTPFGIQIVGPNGSDALVLEAAHAMEHDLADNVETRRLHQQDWPPRGLERQKDVEDTRMTFGIMNP